MQLGESKQSTISAPINLLIESTKKLFCDSRLKWSSDTQMHSLLNHLFCLKLVLNRLKRTIKNPLNEMEISSGKSTNFVCNT